MNRRTLLAASSAALITRPAGGSAIADTGEPGRAEVIVRNGEISVAVAGERVRGSGVAVEPGDFWHIGSNTKSMTGLLAARLAARETVALDEPVAEMLDGISIHGDFRDVTLADLLQHRSGLRANISLFQQLRMSGLDGARDARADRAELVARYMRRGAEAPRGTYLYSNLGYVVAGHVLERAAGAPWEALIAREVFAPLGLEAGFGPPAVGERDRSKPSQPWGHRALFGPGRGVAPDAGADNPPYLSPAGRVHLSAETMGRYLLAHLERSEGYLPRALWDRAHAPVGEERYGFGWGALPDGSFAHDGSNGLWYCHMRIWPERRRAYAAFANEARSDTARWMAGAGSALAET
ncbi:MAG: serine hydrolase domain-containing protein [Pseudomonadota bacterium]